MWTAFTCKIWDDEEEDFGGCVENLILPAVVAIPLTISLIKLYVKPRYSLLNEHHKQSATDYFRMGLTTLLNCTLLAFIAWWFIQMSPDEKHSTIGQLIAASILTIIACEIFLITFTEAIRNSKEDILVKFSLSLLLLHAVVRLQTVVRRTLESSHHTYEMSLWDWFSYGSSILSFLIWCSYLLFNARNVRISFKDLENCPTMPHPSPETGAGVFSTITFGWLNPYVKRGYDRAIELKDLPDLDPKEECAGLYEKLSAAWDREMLKPPHKRYFLLVLLRSQWKLAAAAGALKLVNDAFTIAGPLLLRNIVQYLSDASNPNSRRTVLEGYGYTVALFFCLACQSIALHQYFQRQTRLGIRLRSSIIALVYAKCLKIASGNCGPSKGSSESVGNVVNLMSTDAERIRDLMNYGQLIWTGPLQIIIGLALLFLTVGVSAVGGISVALISLPLLAIISRKIKKLQRLVMAERDRRLNMTTEALSGIRTIKMFAWENSFIGKILAIRSKELQQLWTYQVWSNVTRVQWALTPVLITLFIFILYILLGNTLNAATAFFVLAMVNVLRFPMQLLPITLNNWMEALVSGARIQNYLEKPEAPPLKIEQRPFSSRASKEEAPLLQMSDAEFKWGNGNLLLKNLNVQIFEGELVAVLGATGCGKSGFLDGILQELRLTRGSMNLYGTVSYASQVPWVQNCTVRDNICFGEPYDEEKYNRILDMCCLSPDLSVLPAQDMTEIGERGINLSGGQKQRISMARALYREADIYIFDDCFSALDANVCNEIFDKCFLNYLRKKTVLLVTHHLEFLPQFSKIIFLEKNTQVYYGDFNGLQECQFYQKYSYQMAEKAEIEESSVEQHTDDASITEEHPDKTGSTADIPLSSMHERTNSSRTRSSSDINIETNVKSSKIGAKIDVTKSTDNGQNNDGKLTDSEHVESGNVAAKIYLLYIKSARAWPLTMVLISSVLAYTSQGLSGVWLSYWSDHDEAVSGEMGISTYAFLTFIQMFFYFVGFLSMSLAAQNAARRLHMLFIENVMRAPISFFDVTPLGRIINRFTKDVYSIDEELPILLQGMISTVFNLLVVLVIIASALPQILGMVAMLSVAYYMAQRYYIPTSRQLQRVDSSLKSPIFANFAETLDGVTTVRAFQHEGRFHEKCKKLVDCNTKAYFIRMTSNRWLGMRLEFVGAVVVASTAVFSVGARGVLAAGIGGLVVSYALQTTQNLTFIVRFFSQVQSSIVSVERVTEYSTSIPIEADQERLMKYETPDWPPHGGLVFENFCARYRPELPFVLKNINVSIQAGDKIGVVGRTGAGKSSVILSILRIVEADSGRILLDGVDIADVNIRTLRSKMCTIPQSPTLFAGTVRFNLDPLNIHSDENIWNALERAHIKSFIQSLGDDPLNHYVEEGGKTFSVGQRQLLCLARAILREAKLVLLDEATSVVDPHTDQLIQMTLEQEFKACTLITIAHRIHTILQSDKILVLKDGEVVDYDAPQTLFAKEGVFRSMCLESGLGGNDNQLLQYSGETSTPITNKN